MIIELETDAEKFAICDLESIVDSAFAGDRKSQNYLKKLWDGENWPSIKEKIECEGSTWYVWMMDGVRKHLQNLIREYQKDKED